MPNPLALTLQALGPQTASGQSATFDLQGASFATDALTRRLAELMLEVTAVAGTAPTLNVTVQTSPNTTSFRDVLSFSEFAAVGYQRLKFAPLERYVRVKWAIAGSAGQSFTFTVAGFAHAIYADQEDFFLYGLPRSAVPDQTDPVDILSGCLLGASSTANAKIPRAYVLPLKSPYPESLRLRVAKIAAYMFLAQRGFDPDDPADKEVKAGHDDAEKWLDLLGGGVEPDWVDATPETYDAGAGVASGLPRRDWDW
ncbi:MAG TPA: phage protein Gp36 family protein [Planctomycetota bacterium]|nr:phage protein Gp36 family protein [Planctomycetota bacterium]